MVQLKNLASRFMQEEDGVTAIEYGMIAALIIVGLLAGLTEIGTDLAAKFTTLAGKL